MFVFAVVKNIETSCQEKQYVTFLDASALFVAPWFVRQKTVYIFQEASMSQNSELSMFLLEIPLTGLPPCKAGLARILSLKLPWKKRSGSLSNKSWFVWPYDQELLTKALTEENVSGQTGFSNPWQWVWWAGDLVMKLLFGVLSSFDWAALLQNHPQTGRFC